MSFGAREITQWLKHLWCEQEGQRSDPRALSEPGRHGSPLSSQHSGGRGRDHWIKLSGRFTRYWQVLVSWREHVSGERLGINLYQDAWYKFGPAYIHVGMLCLFETSVLSHMHVCTLTPMPTQYSSN